MQTNAMKRALERGETQVGVWINMCATRRFCG